MRRRLKLALALGAVFLACGCDPPDNSARSDSTSNAGASSVSSAGASSSSSSGTSGASSQGSAGILDASWFAPTTNSDGSPLNDLAFYRLYYGATSTPCPGPSFVQVASATPSPQINEVVTLSLTGLLTGTRYFAAITAVDSDGHESACSSVASAVARSVGSAAGLLVGFTDSTGASGVTPSTTAQPVSALMGVTVDLGPQTPGTTVTFTAIATGGAAPYQFKWWLWDGATWTVLKDWSPDDTLAWTPSTPNPNYAVEVWVRSAGNIANQPDGYPDTTGGYRAIAFAIN